MVSEASNNNVGSSIFGYAAFPTITAVGSAGMALKTHGKNVFKAQNNEVFRALDKQMADMGVDTFTRSQALANAYDNYKDIAKRSAKFQKKLERAKSRGNEISLWQKFKNLFHKKDNKVTFESIKSKAETSTEALNKANAAIKSKDAKLIEEALDLKDGKKFFTDIAESAGKTAAKSGFKATAEGALKYTANNFKNELGWKNGKFNYFMTAVQFIPNIFKKVIPAFKNEGFGEGMKEVGKTCAQAGADLVAYSAGGAIGRTIGAFIGRFVTRGSGVGAKVGAQIGDMIGSMLVGTTVCNTVDKIIGADKDETVANDHQAYTEGVPSQSQYKLSYQA